jgi:hypothetical protein
MMNRFSNFAFKFDLRRYITAVNDVPVFTVSAPWSYTERSGLKFVDEALTLADVDTDTMTQVTVKIASGFDFEGGDGEGGDVLSCATDPATRTDDGASYGLSKAYNPATVG